jgi:RNA-directed DNA polymerase
VSFQLTATTEELKEKFQTLQTRWDVANLLDVKYTWLNYHLYISQKDKRYTTFSINKKTGGARIISAPRNGLKIIQQKLNQVLQAVYQPKPSTHGFSLDRSVVTNAEQHINRRYVLNVDFQDFFPSINFGRVRGLFLNVPYSLPEEVATVLAQICCHENQLPQGAPTSPIISNLICAKLDSQLQRLAKQNRCTYTRYADDLTFSTTLRVFPSQLATTISGITEQIEIGDELYQVIKANGFEVNHKKLRLQTKQTCQEVTGLTVNEFVNVQRKYIRQIRAMLHAWEKYGEEAAFQEFIHVYDQKHRRKPLVRFGNVVKGKIDYLGMVKGKNDSNYIRFRNRLRFLAPDLVTEDRQTHRPIVETPKIAPLLITEGKTDWKHLKAALVSLKGQSLFQTLSLDFHEYEDDAKAGADEILKECEHRAKRPNNPIPTIYIFDRDVKDIVGKAMDKDKPYKSWGHNVYSFVIPLPSHREQTPDISIEYYYRDEEIKTKDTNGRRLFLSSEFSNDSGKHLEIKTINCADRKKYSRPTVVIDNDVFDEYDNKIALSKSHFANYILEKVEPFHSMDFTSFSSIFIVIEQILQENSPQKALHVATGF